MTAAARNSSALVGSRPTETRSSVPSDGSASEYTLTVSQQRGRVFLPFMDDDPWTAEVISKVVLLARDDKIQDPTILEQLRR